MSSELPIIAKVYEILHWTHPHLAKLRRTHRFLAGDRVATGMYRLLETVHGLSRRRRGVRRRLPALH